MVAIVEDLIRGVEEGGRCPKATARTRQDAGVILAGVTVASSCQIILPVFGVLFFVVGTVLTVASYRGPEPDEQPDQYEDRVNLTGNLRVLGPICLAIGLGMICAGITLFVAARRKKQNNLTYHCPIHGDFYPLSASHNHILPLRKLSNITRPGIDELLATPQCPHSNRSSVSNGPTQPHPSPLPPVMSNTLLSPYNLLHLGDSSGSTQSLAVSYDVASFPHSRSTSPFPDTLDFESTDKKDSQSLH